MSGWDLYLCAIASMTGLWVLLMLPVFRDMRHDRRQDREARTPEADA